MIFSRVNIWSKLLFAFSFISALMVLVGLMAILIFDHSGRLMEEISEKHLPEIVQVAEFARIGGEIVTVAPNILTASDDDVRKAVKADLDFLLIHISEQFETLSIPQSDFRLIVGDLVRSLKDNLEDLLVSVELQVEQQDLIDKKTERLRWLYADLMGELDPLSQDYAYNVDAEAERIVDSVIEGGEGISASDLQISMRVKEAIEKIRSNSVLLVNLMMQASTFNNKARLDNLGTLAEDTIALLNQDIKELQDDISSMTLRHVLAEIYEMAAGKESVFAVRMRIIDHEIQGQDILKQNRVYVAELDEIIDKIVRRSENRVNGAAESTQNTLKRARTALVLIILLSFVTVGAVMWFYVRGSIVARLAGLSRSMQAISKGDLSHDVPEGGRDEIGEMAAALKVFRDTAIEVEEANLQAIIDNAAVGLILASPDGVVHSFNSKAEELFGSDARGVMAGTSVFDIVEKKDRAILASGCSEVLKAGEKHYMTGTYIGVRADGSRFPVDIFVTKVQQRHTTRLMITVHDVTEREQSHDLLRDRVREKTEHLSKINEKLREEVKERRRIQSELVQAGKLAALGQLSTGIAHELNQPLSAIRYYLHNAAKLLEIGETDTHQENLVKMDELVERMALMINHLKTFARRQPKQLGLIDIAATIDKAFELIGGKIEKNNIEVVRDYAFTPLNAYGDEIGLEQVLINIFGNAIDAILANPSGKRELAIRADDVGDKVIIEVTDNGPGLETQDPELVFDPFYTTKEVGHGLGLGLSISYNIIKSFGGSIAVANRELGGARFTVSLQKTATEHEYEAEW